MFFSATDEHGFSRMKRGGVKGAFWLTRSREAAKGDAGWCWYEHEHEQENGASVWCCGEWCLRDGCPLTPDPSPPVGARGASF